MCLVARTLYPDCCYFSDVIIFVFQFTMLVSLAGQITNINICWRLLIQTWL